MKVWLVGAGPMAVDYFKVLAALEADLTVIGRGAASANRFEATTGAPVVTGGLESFLETSPTLPDAAIVSVNMETLASTAAQLLQTGVHKLLVEKPAAIDTGSLKMLAKIGGDAGAEIFVAYNRRCYAATLHAKRVIDEDGGLLSCNFEFTEWTHVVEKQDYPQSVKERWLLANSTHVIDLAFHLGGVPVRMDSHVSGSLAWHPSASIFAGAGVSERGVLYSYQANWGAPGRWGLEALTPKHRLILRPMETLQIIRKGSVLVEPVEINDMLDKSFKPGLHEQVSRFLSGRYEGLCSVNEQLQHWPYYCRMAGYQPS